MSDGERSGLLPAGRQLAVTWSIPDEPGGMTAAMLRRSRAFAELAGAEVDVLTFEPRPDYAAVRERLTALGALVPGVRLRNLYEELRGDPPGAGPGTVVASPTSAGRRVEHRRADGSLAVLDDQPASRDGRRLITAFDREERPLRRWASAWACYRDWLADVAAGGPAFAIVDSKTAARFVARVRVPGLTTIHVVHNAHLAGSRRPLGPLRASRSAVLARPERFDSVVFLTERQRADAAALLADAGNLAVVPNPADTPAGRASGRADSPRDPASVVVVAGLTRRKRVDHAIDAVALARAAGVPARLRVIGSGPERDRLVDAVREGGLEGAVGFDGHRPDAAQAFAEASVTLLTSTSEGAPLVLLEAMGRGCVPIAYDIPYGPGDLIEHGTNGFLVAPGDRGAASAAIAHVAEMPEAERSRLRAAARATADRFGDAEIVARWGEVQRAAAARHAAAPPGPVEVRRLRVRRPGDRVRVSARLEGVPHGADVIVRLERRPARAVVGRRVAPRRGRVDVRFTADETALLGAGALTVRIVVAAGQGHRELPAIRVQPDTRTLPRRLSTGFRSRLGAGRSGTG